MSSVKARESGARRALPRKRLLRGVAALGGLAAWLIWAGAPRASEIVYRPVNPSFGGNPFNSDHLLGIANAQNDFEAKSKASGLSNSPADQFVRQLQSRLLSALANQVTDALFGDTPADHGVITFSDQTIEFNRGLTDIELTITDASTGAVTHISVPNLVVP